MVDVLCPELPPGSTRVHAEVVIRAGGSAVNAAAAAAAAGASATVVGRVGRDRTGELVAAELEALGVEGRLALDEELPTGVAVALGSALGPTVVASRGANERLRTEDVPRPLHADALLVSGFALLQSGSAAAAGAALERFTGTWAAVDVGSPALAARAGDADFGDARVLLATAEEARALTGAAPEAAARALAARFSIACVKLGADGAIAASGELVERRAAEAIARRSPFGAGDAFGAVLLVALASGEPLGRALERACDAGARAAATAGL